MFRLRGRTTVFLHDVLLIPVAWYLAYWLRFNLDTIPVEFMQAATLTLPVIILCQSSSYIAFGLYRGIWRFASLPDLVRIGKSVFLGVLISMLVVFLITRMEAIPRTVIPLYAILLFIFLGGNRILYRYLKDRRVGISDSKRVLVDRRRGGRRDVAEGYVNAWPGAIPARAGMIDDDPGKTGREIHGIRVLGYFR